MSLQNTTPVPNVVLDEIMKSLKYAELKVLLLIVRQTYGWIDPKNPRKRKEFDRITIGQMANKTGCSRRVISEAIDFLVSKKYIKVLDYDGNNLTQPEQRRGKTILYFMPTLNQVQKSNKSSYLSALHPVTKSNITKERIKKIENKDLYPVQIGAMRHISHILKTTNYEKV